MFHNASLFSTQRLAQVLVILSGLFLSVGCGSLYQKLPVSKSTALRNKVEKEVGGVTQSLEQVRKNARSISDIPPDIAKTVNVASLRQAMQGCFKTKAKTNKKGQVNSCTSAKNPKVQGFQQLPARSKQFVKDKIQLVDSIRKDLLSIPKRLKQIPGLAKSVPLEMGKLWLEVEAKHKANMLLGGKHAARSKREKKKFEENFNYVKDAPTALLKEIAGMPKELASIGKLVVKDLANFGKSSISR